MSPDAAVAPVAQAPPDRPTAQLEQLLRQLMGVLFADRVLDQDEKKLLYTFFQEVSMRAQNGGIGQGGTPPAELGDTNMPPAPADLNHNTEDLGTVEGAEPQGEYGYA
jgi:hypothetical protein